jgi:hypothetical protein
MAHFDPISFLPEDKIGPALQNLAQTQQAIGNAKIQEMQGQITAFNNLLDVSLEGLMTKHQEEVVGDVDKFKDHAAELYRNAFEGGGRPNFKDISTLNTEKKQILYKVNQSKFLQDQYKQAMLKASVLGDKIGPTVKDDLTKWLHQSETIGATADPMSLVNMKYDMLDMTDDYDKLIKGTKDSALKSPQSVMNPKTGKEERRVIWDPKEQSDVIWDNIPRISDFWTKKAGGDTRKGKQMYDAWTQEQSVNALDLQGGTTVNNFVSGFGGDKDKFKLMPKVAPDGQVDYNFTSKPMSLRAGPYKGDVGNIHRDANGKWTKKISQVLVEKPDGSFSLGGESDMQSFMQMLISQGEKVSKTERGELIMELNPNDVNQLAWLPIEFMKADQHGLDFNNPESPISNYPYPKEKPGFSAPGFIKNTMDWMTGKGGKPKELKSKTVVQDGYTYTLNEETGQYE